jgi:hypothetical protein
MNNSKSKTIRKLVDWKIVTIGILIICIADFIYGGSIVYYLYYYSGGLNLDDETITIISMFLAIIAGFTVAILNKHAFNYVIPNLVLATIIGIYISNLIIEFVLVFTGIKDDAIFYIIIDPIFAIIFLSIPVFILGIFGAFIGTTIKKIIVKNQLKVY